MPQTPLGKPFFEEIFVHVSPPSVLFQRPLPSPPLSMLYGVRTMRHVPAYKTEGLPGSITMSETPARLLTNKVRFHVLPPSVVLYTPRISFAPKAWPNTPAHAVFGSLG